MAGNSQRRGAMRKTGQQEGRDRRLRRPEGQAAAGQGADAAGGGPHRPSRGPARGVGAASRDDQHRAQQPQPGGVRRPDGKSKESGELVVGRNTVVEALRAQVPATALYVAARIDTDDRVREALKLAGNRGLPLLEAPRPELDRLSAGARAPGPRAPGAAVRVRAPRGPARGRAASPGSRR